MTVFPKELGCLKISGSSLMPLEYKCSVSSIYKEFHNTLESVAIPDDGLKQPENMEQDDADKNPDQRVTR